MGIQDRDYMHERSRRGIASGAQRKRAMSTGRIVCLIAAAFLLLHQGYGWLLRHPSREKYAQSLLPTLPPIGREVQPMKQPLYPAPETHIAPSQESPAQQAVYTTLYFCKNYNGLTFWTRLHCNQQKALIDRMTDVPANLTFDRQVEIAEDRRQAAIRLTSPTRAAPATPAAQGQDRRGLCTRLNEQIAHWDAMARQPHSGHMQDWIREQRKKVRDEQFRRRC